MKFSAYLIAGALAISCIASVAQKIPKGYNLVYEQSFKDKGSRQGFIFTQPDKWIFSDGKNSGALEFTGKSDYEPPFRSPHTIGLIKDLVVGDFILEADFVQTGREYGHRDVCIIFGFQDVSHFYYSHVATKGDDNAHQIMIVNQAPRLKISTMTTEGVNWGENVWHKIRVERSVEEGTIKVFFDDMTKPIQEASDKTFGAGYIGFGSFDDSGKVDNIKIWGRQAEKKEAKFFETN